MNSLSLNRTHGEDGAAIVEFVFVVPMIILMVAGVLDLSALIKCNLALDSAATAAVRYCMDIPQAAEDTDELKRYLATIDPAFENLELSVSLGGLEHDSYTHIFYQDLSDNPIKRDSNCSYQPFIVELIYTGSYYTLVGRGISLASGGNGSLKVTSCEAGCIDRTDGSTW